MHLSLITSFFDSAKFSKVQGIDWSLAQKKGVEVAFLREDLLHPEVSGNKFRKLKYNLLKARQMGVKKLLTFGGAYSNHVAAVAAAAQMFHFEAVGIIRGEDLDSKISENPTLNFAQTQGMQLHFVSRVAYRQKNNPEFLTELDKKFGSFYLIPEGGSNLLAVKGCTEILHDGCTPYQIIVAAVGTGATLAGLILSAQDHQQVWGFSALKGSFLLGEICKFAGVGKDAFKLVEDYHFGGYARCTPELIHFMNQFYDETEVLLDPVYTGKMLFGLADLIRKGSIKPGTRILAVHTGGLQGIAGMNQRLMRKGMPMIVNEAIQK